MSKQNDDLYKGPAALDAFDLGTFPDSEEARLGANAFLAPGDLAYFEETLRLYRPSRGEGPQSGEIGGGALVELGCGRGALGRHLAERLGMSLVGVDASGVAIEQARAVPTTVQARWLVCNFDKLPLEAGSALGIVSLDGISLAVDPRAMLREVARISMPGAPLIFTACVPRFREGALDWRSGLHEHDFAVLEYLEVSEAWHAWLRKKHERRLARAAELNQRMEEREAAAALAESKAILAEDPPRFTTQRRFRITARYKPPGTAASR
jgi:ubiquinone/menaquinone biosynthesis C-methylase UbiE